MTQGQTEFSSPDFILVLLLFYFFTLVFESCFTLVLSCSLAHSLTDSPILYISQVGGGWGGWRGWGGGRKGRGEVMLRYIVLLIVHTI